MLKLSKPGKSKFTAEEAAELSLQEVKEIIEAQVPDAFAAKKAAAKSATKKATKTKSVAKKKSAKASVKK